MTPQRSQRRSRSRLKVFFQTGEWHFDNLPRIHRNVGCRDIAQYHAKTLRFFRSAVRFASTLQRNPVTVLHPREFRLIWIQLHGLAVRLKAPPQVKEDVPDQQTRTAERTPTACPSGSVRQVAEKPCRSWPVSQRPDGTVQPGAMTRHEQPSLFWDGDRLPARYMLGQSQLSWRQRNLERQFRKAQIASHALRLDRCVCNASDAFALHER